ncbi:hypothetical protein BH11ARM1_BH11ARM1_15680 [soil metagenome]
MLATSATVISEAATLGNKRTNHVQGTWVFVSSGPAKTTKQTPLFAGTNPNSTGTIPYSQIVSFSAQHSVLGFLNGPPTGPTWSMPFATLVGLYYDELSSLFTADVGPMTEVWSYAEYDHEDSKEKWTVSGPGIHPIVDRSRVWDDNVQFKKKTVPYGHGF